MNNIKKSSEKINKVAVEKTSALDEQNKNDLLFNNIAMENLSYEQVAKILSVSSSLLSKHLTEDVFNNLKNKKTSWWVTLFDIIKWSLVRPICKIGVYAWDDESYSVFEEILSPIVESHHGVDSSTVYPKGKLGPISSNIELDLDSESYEDIRMRMGANLKWRFPSTQTLEDRKQLEDKVSSLLKKEFWGEYFSVVNTSPEQWKEWQDKGYGFALEDEYLKEAWIITDFWPEGSWIWMDDSINPSTIVIINEEDHIRFTGFGKNMKPIYENLSKIYNKLDENLPFAKHEKYWNLWSCPTNIWHMFKTGIRISLPNVQAKYPLDDLKAIAKEYGCEIRWKGWEMSKSFDVIEISNSKRFMPAQEAIEKWTNLLNRLTKMERELKEDSMK